MAGAPFIADEAEITTDLPDILSDETMFRLDLLAFILGGDPLHQSPNNNPHRDDSTLTVGMLGPIHSQPDSPEAA